MHRPGTVETDRAEDDQPGHAEASRDQPQGAQADVAAEQHPQRNGDPAHQAHRGERELARVGIVEQIFEIIEHGFAEHGDGDDHRHHRRVERDEAAVSCQAENHMLHIARLWTVRLSGLAVSRTDKRQYRGSDGCKQDRGAEIGLGYARPRKPSSDRDRGQRLRRHD